MTRRSRSSGSWRRRSDPDAASARRPRHGGRRRRPVRRARLSKTDGFGKTRQAGTRRSALARHSFPSTATEDRGPFTANNLARFAAWCPHNTGMCSRDPASAVGRRPARRGFVGVTRQRHRVRLAVHASGRGVVRLLTRRFSRPRSGGNGPPGHRRPRPDLEPHRRALRLPDQPAGDGPGAGHPGRVDLLRRPDGPGPPDHLVQGAAGRPVLLHRDGPHPGVVRGPGVPAGAARRHPVRGRPGQGRLPAGDRLHRALRLDHGCRRPGRDATTPSRCHGRRPGCSVSARGCVVLAEADGRARDDKYGVFVGSGASDPWSGCEKGYELPDATPTPRPTTGRSTSSVRRPAAPGRRDNPPGGGTRSRSWRGERCSLPQAADHDFTNTTRPLRWCRGSRPANTGTAPKPRPQRGVKELGGPRRRPHGPIVGLAGKCLDSPAATPRRHQIQIWTATARRADGRGRPDPAGLGKCLDARALRRRTRSTLACKARRQNWGRSDHRATRVGKPDVRPQHATAILHMWTCHTGANSAGGCGLTVAGRPSADRDASGVATAP